MPFRNIGWDEDLYFLMADLRPSKAKGKNTYNGASTSLDAFEVPDASSQLFSDAVDEDLEFSQLPRTPVQSSVMLPAVCAFKYHLFILIIYVGWYNAYDSTSSFVGISFDWKMCLPYC